MFNIPADFEWRQSKVKSVTDGFCNMSDFLDIIVLFEEDLVADEPVAGILNSRFE